jgi:hypothetical protein
MDAPRAHTDGTMIFPWGLQYPVQSVGSLKHTWGYKNMADSLSALVRGTVLLPNLLPIPVGTLNWFQAWDNAGKGAFIFPLRVTFRSAYIELFAEVDSLQYLAQPDYTSSGQLFRLQITDQPETLSIVTTPKPVGLPLSYTGTEITLPMCGPGADVNQKMVWKVNNMYTLFDFVDFAGGHTLYQRVNVTGSVWFNGKPTDIAGIGLVEVYHRA